MCLSKEKAQVLGSRLREDHITIQRVYMGFPRTGDIFLGVPIIRVVVFWGLYGVL